MKELWPLEENKYKMVKLDPGTFLAACFILILEQVLTNKDRAGLIDDAFALSFAGQLDSMVALNLSTYLVQERDYVPWIAATSWFGRFDGLLSDTSSYEQYRVRCYIVCG